MPRTRQSKTHKPAQNLDDIKAMFSLKKPCEHCPFRKDVQPYLGKERIESIIAGHKEGMAFFCHQTTTKTGYKTTDKRARYCAGYHLMSVHLDRLPMNARLGITCQIWSPKELSREIPVVQNYKELRKQHEAEADY